MASKRAVRRKTCSSKTTYFREVDAVGVAIIRSKAIGEKLHAYRCPFGQHWHVGHVPTQHKRTRRAQFAEG